MKEAVCHLQKVATVEESTQSCVEVSQSSGLMQETVEGSQSPVVMLMVV